MAFQDDETSVQDGVRIELFKFTGTYQTWYLTSYADDFINSEATWDGGSIDRDNVERGSQEDEELGVQLKLAANHPMVTAYAIQVAPPDLNLEVYLVHPANPDDTQLIFEGPPLSWSVTGSEATVAVPNLFSYLFDQPVPSHKYQAPCNYKLGDARCKIDMILPENQHVSTISSIVGDTVVVADSPFTDEDCVAGRMIVGTEERTIVSNVGTTFTISSAFSPNVIATNSVTFRRGCNKLMLGDCLNKFNNVRNFGGFPYVPNQNPYSNRL